MLWWVIFNALIFLKWTAEHCAGSRTRKKNADDKTLASSRPSLKANSPRIKRVCRSASLALGQPRAVFETEESTASSISPQKGRIFVIFLSLSLFLPLFFHPLSFFQFPYIGFGFPPFNLIWFYQHFLMADRFLRFPNFDLSGLPTSFSLTAFSSCFSKITIRWCVCLLFLVWVQFSCTC